MRTALILLLAIVCGGPRVAAAQRPGPSVLRQRPDTLVWLRPSLATKQTQAPDHRWEGAAIGAGVGAVAFGLLGAIACGQSDSDNTNCTGVVVGTALLGVLAGGITGGLIGGSIPKEEPTDSSNQTNSVSRNVAR